MKALFLVPEKYGLYHHFREAFASQGVEVISLDFANFVQSWETKVNTQIFRTPDSIRRKWENYFFDKINTAYREAFDRIQPDLVFVYNNAMLLPSTMDYFRLKGKVKLVFFLGDSPYYTPTNRYNLSLLFQADQVFAPDTYWIGQLRKIGLERIQYLLPGIPEGQYFETELSKEEKEKYESQVLYVGMSYPNSWGYKKARFLSHFCDFDLQIHGSKHWKKWFRFFPELEAHFLLRSGYIPVEQMNAMYNATRIIPIDGNPGVLNGIHHRIMEALGSGALPMLEWQEDLNTIFGKGTDLPAPRNYDGLKSMAGYYLENEDRRFEKVKWMQNVVREKCSVESNGELLLNATFSNSKVPAKPQV